MTDLTDYGGGTEATRPLVERRVCIQSPHTGKLCGFVGHDVRRGFTVYATRRQEFHYYRKGDGYAISDSILADLGDYGVARVLVYEHADAGDAVYEYALRDYVGGQAVPERDLFDEDDPQTFVPFDDAMNAWPDHARNLFRYEFDDAMDRIDWRGFDADHPARSDR